MLGDQLLRSGTAVAANYRAACRARSTAEFVSKLGVVLEESDESALWMELIVEDSLLPAKRVESLLKEANELTASQTSCVEERVEGLSDKALVAIGNGTDKVREGILLSVFKPCAKVK